MQGILNIEIETCKATLRWNHRDLDHRLRIEYIISQGSRQTDHWLYEDTSVGNVTLYTFSQCILQPGRLYRFSIRSNVELTNPNETYTISSYSMDVIMGM